MYDKMKKNGFTLVELIGVIIILGVIGLLAFPPIINSIKNSKKDLSNATKELIYSATELYVDKYKNQYIKKPGKVYCVSLRDLASNDFIISPITDSVTGKEIDLNKQVQVTVSNQSYEYSLPDICVVSPYEDPSGASHPNLSTNMIPIKHDGTNWVKADTSQEWYNYNKQQWANAVTVTEATRNTYQNAAAGTVVKEDDILTYMVWIPRYKYKLFNANNGSKEPQQIEIVFESKETSPSCGGNTCTTNRVYSTGTNGEYLTHPAFTFGTEELDGFWVGKFETSHETLSSSTTANNLRCNNTSCSNANGLRIKPNVVSLRYNDVSNMFYASQSMNNNSVFGYDGSSDVHMMKNMEWGATAYLKQSKYGMGITDIGINNNSNFTTGCGVPTNSGSTSICSAYNTTNGMLASTTGNIYGVYDMSGGAWEYVMGNMANTSGVFYSSYAGFTTTPASKYYDSYTYGTTYNDSAAHGRGLLGDATKETLKAFGTSSSGGWYSAYSYFVYSTYAWFLRGGYIGYASSAGVFSFVNFDGGANGYYSWRLASR